jgi:hypothetical protein
MRHKGYTTQCVGSSASTMDYGPFLDLFVQSVVSVPKVMSRTFHTAFGEL